MKCHGAETQKGDSAGSLTEFKAADGHLWTLVHEVLSAAKCRRRMRQRGRHRKRLLG